MTTFSKINSDDANAPNNYFVRIDLGQEEIKTTGSRYIYYENPTKISKTLNCSRSKIIQLIGGRRTVPLSEYVEFNSSPKIKTV